MELKEHTLISAFVCVSVCVCVCVCVCLCVASCCRWMLSPGPFRETKQEIMSWTQDEHCDLDSFNTFASSAVYAVCVCVCVCVCNTL